MQVNRNGIQGSCYRSPDLHISTKNLTGCMSLDSIGSVPSLMVHIHLKSAKQRTFQFSLSGIGLNCSPVSGFAMATISNNGDSIWCKASVGSREERVVTCPYQCQCPDVCSSTMAYIRDKIGVCLCKISEWNGVTSVLKAIMHVYAKHILTTHSLKCIPN